MAGMSVRFMHDYRRDTLSRIRLNCQLAVRSTTRD